MRWRKLKNRKEETLWRGTVFRLLASDWPYETPVDFMLVESASAPSGFSLIVASGYKAGLVLMDLPASAKARGKAQAISRDWLITHWDSKVYAPCPVERVRVIDNYPPGVHG